MFSVGTDARKEKSGVSVKNHTTVKGNSFTVRRDDDREVYVVDSLQIKGVETNYNLHNASE